MSMLHAEGNMLVDESGQIVTLRGTNKRSFVDHPFSHWQTPEGGTEWGTWNPSTVLANFDAMKKWGMNCIRIMPRVSYWKDNVQGHRDVIKQFLNLAYNRGQYVILSFWTVNTNQQSSLPYPPYSNAGEETTIASKEEFVEFWRQLAGELKDFPNVLFSLWNEAGMLGNQNDASAQAEWFGVTQQCITAIREAGAKQPIVVQWATQYANISSRKPNPIAPDYGQTLFWSTYYPLTDSENNLVYEFHNYFRDIHKFIDGVKTFCYTTEDIMTGLDYMAILQTLNVLNRPVLLGEIGVGATVQPNELQWFINYLEVCKTLGINFCTWWWWWGGNFPLLTTAPNYQPNNTGTALINALEGETFPALCSLDSDCPIGYRCENNVCVLDIPRPEDIFEQTTCENYGYFWYDDACWLQPKEPEEPEEPTESNIGIAFLVMAVIGMALVMGKGNTGGGS